MTHTMAALMQEDRARVRDAIQRAGLTVAAFQQIDPRTTLRYVLTTWLAIAATAALWQSIDGAWALLLIPGIAVIQHALLNVVHEASHGLLLRDRDWNERVGNLFAALPIAHTVASYRLTHLDHHNYLRTPQDPSSYVTRPGLSSGEIRRTLLFLLCGRLVWELAARTLLGRRLEVEAKADRETMQTTDRSRLLAVAIFNAGALAVCFALDMPGFWAAWIVTVMTVTPVLDGIRTIVEHRTAPGDTRLAFHTRSHHRNVLVSALMAPFFQYHWEHHLFPSLPHHQLARLHRLLIEQEVPGARPPEGGFFAVLWRLV